MRKQSLLTLMKVFTFAMLFFTTTIQAQNYAWAETMGGIQNDQVHAVTTDADGNVYVCGSFKYTVDFDPGVNETNITSTGNYDIFIQKLNPAGELQWVKSFGSTGPDDALDLKLDANGNVYVIGNFTKTVDFDPGVETTSITSHGASDIFLQKLDTDGNFQWVKTWGSTSIDKGAALAIDNAGNIFTTGLFKYTVDFDLGAGTAELTAPGTNKNIFIQKMDSNGDFVWVKGLIGATCNSTAITTDEFGNVFTTGYFTGTVDFNPSAVTDNRTSRGANDIFTQKLESNGDFVWVSTIEGTTDNTPSALAVAPDGSVFVTGSFTGTADFDPSANSMDIPTTGLADGFLQKLDNNGDLMFVKRIGGSKDDRVNDIFITDNNQIWLTGYFQSSMMLGSNHNMVSNGDSKDILVANYELDGTFNSAFSFGGALTDMGQKITYSGTDLITVGTFTGNNVDFDVTINSDVRTNNGLADIFVQKLSFCISADIPTASVSATETCAGEQVTFEIISGELNSAANWVWREGSCTGNYVGEGTSVSVNPKQTTTYYVSGEGGCVTNSECQTIEITVLSTPTTTVPVSICEGESYTFPDGTQEDNITTNFTQNSVFSAVSGCDSTIITEITVNPSMTTEENANICVGESFTFADGTTIDNIQDVTNYSSVLSSATGCDSTVVQTVTPTVINATLTVNGNTLMTAVQEATFQWVDCATDLPVEGATGPSFTPSQSGEYAVIITSPGGCQASSSCELMTIVGTSAPAREKQFDVYPNPMISTLDVNITSTYKEGSLVLYHITGQRVYAQDLHGEHQIQINVNDLSQGTYYLKVITDGIPAVTKVIK